VGVELLSIGWFFVVGYKGRGIYWLAIHCNQANLIVAGPRHRRTNKTRRLVLADQPALDGFRTWCCI
jgi:hypothetical protein